MTRILHALALLLWSAASALAGSHAAGITQFRHDASGTARALTGHLWYPATAGGATMRFGENAVFEGVEAHPGAPFAPGRFPLVVLSHGLDGNSLNQAWLAKALAEAGFVVVAPNHPGTTTWDRDRIERARLWERPRDLTQAIDLALADPLVGPAIDHGRVAAIGHSLGGWTVMALAGARFDVARHRAYCAAHRERPDCRFVDEAAIGSTPAAIAALQAPYLDPRLRAVVVLDLALTQVLDPTSLAEIVVPTLVVGAPSGGTLDLDAESRALVSMLPPSLVEYVEPVGVGHYDFVGTCKPGGAAILAAEEPEFVSVCAATSAERAARHAFVADLTRTFFAAHLAGDGGQRDE